MRPPRSRKIRPSPNQISTHLGRWSPNPSAPGNRNPGGSLSPRRSQNASTLRSPPRRPALKTPPRPPPASPPNPAAAKNTPPRPQRTQMVRRSFRGNQQRKPAQRRTRERNTGVRTTSIRAASTTILSSLTNTTSEAAHPRTEQERADHIEDAFARLDKADAGGFSTNELYTIDPKGEIWSADRTLLHHSLLEDIYARAADVPCDHEAIVAGDLAEQERSTVLANHPDIDGSKYLTINPDNLKEEMARRSMIPESRGSITHGSFGAGA